MEDFNFEQMLDDFLPEEKKSGDIVEGIITRKEMEYSYLDLGSKKEGRIISSEIKDFNVGDTVEVKVLREDEDNIIVSKFVLDKEREFASYEVNEIVTGKVDKKIKGGYNVKVGKNNAFLPFSLSSFDKNVDYTGKEFKFIIKEKTKKSITVSRTDLVKEEEQKYFDSINEGDVVTGKVKEVLDFGVILDLGVTTGFVHISEVSWDQVNDLVERFGIGEEVSAKIIEKDSVLKCRDFLTGQIALLNPSYIVTVGENPTRSFIKEKEDIKEMVGNSYRYIGDMWIVPVFDIPYLFKATDKEKWKLIKILTKLEKSVEL